MYFHLKLIHKMFWQDLIQRVDNLLDLLLDYGGIKYYQDTLFASTGERADVLKDNHTETKNLLEV